MRLYKEDLEYALKLLWFLNNVKAPDGYAEEFKLLGYDAEGSMTFEWDGEWYMRPAKDEE